MKKTFAILLALFFLLSVFVACTETQKPPVDGTTGASGDDATTPSDDLLPELDFNGTKITIAMRDKYTEYYMGEDGGDVIWASVYRANQAVDDRIGITREYIPTTDSSSDHALQMVTAILSGDAPYDLVLVDQFYGCSYALEGAFANFKDPAYSKYLNLDAERWYGDYMSNASLSEDTLYFLGGDVSPTMLAWSACTFFNWDMYNDNFGDPQALYDEVDNGEWTIDKLAEYSASIYVDMDGSQTVNQRDQVGFAVTTGQSALFAAQCAGFVFTTRNEDGMFELDIVNEKNEKIFEKVFNLYNNTVGAYVYDFRVMGEDLSQDMFRDGSALFINEYFLRAWTPQLREMRNAFGIIPRPKLDEEQKDYITVMQDPLMLYTIPVTLSMDKADAVSAFLEAQSIENHNVVFPAMYDTALKVKFQSDKIDAETASRMIDLICSKITTDFAVVNNVALNGVTNEIAYMIEAGDYTFASTMATHEGVAKVKLEEMILHFGL